MVDLLTHNKIAYEKIVEAFKTTNKTCIVQPTGSGKSHLILKLIEDYIIQKRDIIIVEPQKYIFKQLKEKMNKYKLSSNNVKFITYSALGKIDNTKIQEFHLPKLVIIDEMHRAGAPKWRTGLQTMFNSFPDDCKYIGMSATPIRYLDGQRDMSKELFDGCVANEIGLADAILNRILPLPRYIAGLYSYDSEFNAINKKILQSCNTEEEKRELLEEVKILKNNLDKSSGISDIFKKYIEGDKGKYIAFCSNISHLKSMKPCLEKWFLDAGLNINLYEVHCKNPEKDKQFQSFMNNDGMSVCLSVGMLSEGVHGINGVILLRDTTSPNLYLQEIGRCFSVDMGSVPIIFDFVANCQSIMNCSLKSELLQAIDKRDNDSNKNKATNIDNKKQITRKDIEKFFIFDQVIDSIHAFRDIEGRLKDSWGLWIKALKQYKAREGDCLVPANHIEILKDGSKLRLGNWVQSVRQSKKGNGKSLLTPERIEQLNDLGFVWNRESGFEKFYKYVLLYKEKYGYVNIKSKDEIDGYRIGDMYSTVIQDYKKGKLTEEQVQRLKNIGVDIIERINKNSFQYKLNLAKQALQEGVLISNKNRIYQDVDLYQWKINKVDKFTDEEKVMLDQLVPIKHTRKKVAIINIKSGEINVHSSITEAGKALYNLHIIDDSKKGRQVINNRLTGHTKNPIYKGKYRFEYVD